MCEGYKKIMKKLICASTIVISVLLLINSIAIGQENPWTIKSVKNVTKKVNPGESRVPHLTFEQGVNLGTKCGLRVAIEAMKNESVEPSVFTIDVVKKEIDKCVSGEYFKLTKGN